VALVETECVRRGAARQEQRYWHSRLLGT